MNAYCPWHHVPVYPTNKGGVACILCAKEKRNRRNGTSATVTDPAKLARNREISRLSMQKRRAEKAAK